MQNYWKCFRKSRSIMKFSNLFKKTKIKPPDKTQIDSDIIKFRDDQQKRSRELVLTGLEIVKGIDLKPGDIIIHNYSRFKITECGLGFGAGNEFGDYVWVKGKLVTGNPTDPKPEKDFWTFQRCPIIRYL